MLSKATGRILLVSPKESPGRIPGVDCFFIHLRVVQNDWSETTQVQKCQILTYFRPYKPWPHSVTPTAAIQESAQNAAGGILYRSRLVCRHRSSQRMACPQNWHIRGFVLLCFALSCLGYCLCICFKSQGTQTPSPTIYPLPGPHSPLHQLSIPTRPTIHLPVWFEDL